MGARSPVTGPQGAAITTWETSFEHLLRGDWLVVPPTCNELKVFNQENSSKTLKIKLLTTSYAWTKPAPEARVSLQPFSHLSLPFIVKGLSDQQDEKDRTW